MNASIGYAYKHDNIPVCQTSIYITTNSVTTESILPTQFLNILKYHIFILLCML